MAVGSGAALAVVCLNAVRQEEPAIISSCELFKFIFGLSGFAAGCEKTDGKGTAAKAARSLPKWLAMMSLP